MRSYGAIGIVPQIRALSSVQCSPSRPSVTAGPVARIVTPRAICFKDLATQPYPPQSTGWPQWLPLHPPLWRSFVLGRDLLFDPEIQHLRLMRVFTFTCPRFRAPESAKICVWLDAVRQLFNVKTIWARSQRDVNEVWRPGITFLEHFFFLNQMAVTEQNHPLKEQDYRLHSILVVLLLAVAVHN